MANKTGLLYSPITERIYWGLHNGNGAAVGNKQKDITSDFIQVMEMKFPINTMQNVSVNGENKYRVIIVDMDKEVMVNGKAV